MILTIPDLHPCHDLPPRLPHLRPQQPGARHDVPRQLPDRHDLVDGLGADEPGLLLLIFQLHAGDRRRHRLGEVPVLPLPRHGAADQQPGAGALHDQRRRVQRADPHRRARFRPAEADRHAVPRLAARGSSGRRWAISWSGCVLMGYSLCAAGLRARAWSQIVLYPVYVACGVAIYYSLMIALAADQRVAGPEPDALRLLVLHHQFLPLPDGDLPRPWGTPLRRVFTFCHSGAGGGQRAGPAAGPAACSPQPPTTGSCPLFALVATVASLAASRWVFQPRPGSYRSASS